VALAGIDRSEVRLGDPIVICGAGPIGLVTLLAAHAAGANPIAIIDLDNNRLEMAKKLIPRVRTVQVDLKTAPKDVAAQVRKHWVKRQSLPLSAQVSNQVCNPQFM
jgi:L-iditol 2-dehydrogenase